MARIQRGPADAAPRRAAGGVRRRDGTLYAETDAFIYETFTWNRYRIKQRMRQWILSFLGGDTPARPGFWRSAMVWGSTRRGWHWPAIGSLTSTSAD